MKIVKLALMATMVTACASSSPRLSAAVYEARDGVNAAGTRVRAKVRPAVRPVTASVDRGVGRAAASVGLHVGPSKN